MYLNFSNFRGRTSAGGGQALVQKRGQVSDGGGGLAKFSPDGGPPSPPPRKKTLLDSILKFSFWLNYIYHVKIDCLFTNTKRKIQKFLLKSEELHQFLLSMHKVGMRLICFHVAV